jgi:lipopolysaccharide export system protein LptC
MRWEWRLLAALLVLSAVTALSWWVVRQTQTPSVGLLKPSTHEPDYVLENFSLSATSEAGDKRYRLLGTKLAHYPDDGSSDIENPYLVQTGKDGTMHTRAATAFLPKDRAYVLMKGNVRAAREDPKRARAEIATEQLRITLDK